MKSNAYPEEIYPAVVDVLTKYPSTRNSDLKLYVHILKRFNLPLDIELLSQKLSGDIFSSIKRCRQKAQETNPFLAPDETVKDYRENMEQVMLDFVRGI